MFHRVKEKNPNAILVVVGCYAQVAKDELEKMNQIDLILGTNEKRDIVQYVEAYSKMKKAFYLFLMYFTRKNLPILELLHIQKKQELL